MCFDTDNKRFTGFRFSEGEGFAEDWQGIRFDPAACSLFPVIGNPERGRGSPASFCDASCDECAERWWVN